MSEMPFGLSNWNIQSISSRARCPEACGDALELRELSSPNRHLSCMTRPRRDLDPITANTIMALIAKERETRNSASLIVTHRYQDGELMANFRYDPEREGLEPCRAAYGRSDERTKFIVMKEGEIVFFGSREELESSGDEYVKKFVRKEG